jgi:hypothetical protein
MISSHLWVEFRYEISPIKLIYFDGFLVVGAKYGSLFVPKSSLSQMKKADRIKYIKSFLNWGFIYTVINHPLRLDYFNLPLTKTDGENYMLRDGNKLNLYLNKFKNIKSMGPQVIEYDDPIIIKYLDQVEAITDSKPTHLFWHVVKNEMKLFSRKEVSSHHIINIIKKYTGKSINNNTIRKIWESSLIQSPEYNQMTNKEKNKAHKKLLLVRILQMKRTIKYTRRCVK